MPTRETPHSEPCGLWPVAIVGAFIAGFLSWRKRFHCDTGFILPPLGRGILGASSEYFASGLKQYEPADHVRRVHARERGLSGYWPSLFADEHRRIAHTHMPPLLYVPATSRSQATSFALSWARQRTKIFFHA